MTALSVSSPLFRYSFCVWYPRRSSSCTWRWIMKMIILQNECIIKNRIKCRNLALWWTMRLCSHLVEYSSRRGHHNLNVYILHNPWCDSEPAALTLTVNSWCVYVIPTYPPHQHCHCHQFFLQHKHLLICIKY